MTVDYSKKAPIEADLPEDFRKECSSGTCPNCGYCPHCGRSYAAPPLSPWYPYLPYPTYPNTTPYYQPYTITYTATC